MLQYILLPFNGDPDTGEMTEIFFGKETLIVIKWTAVHEYCNVDLHLYNLIFVRDIIIENFGIIFTNIHAQNLIRVL